MITHTFMTTPQEELSAIEPLRIRIATLGSIIGTLTVSLDYEITKYYYTFGHEKTEITNEELLKQVKALVKTKQDNYFVTDPRSGNGAYFDVIFEEANIGLGLARTQNFEIGRLRRIETQPYTIEVTGNVYNYKVPIKENPHVKFPAFKRS